MASLTAWITFSIVMGGDGRDRQAVARGANLYFAACGYRPHALPALFNSTLALALCRGVTGWHILGISLVSSGIAIPPSSPFSVNWIVVVAAFVAILFAFYIYWRWRKAPK